MADGTKIEWSDATWNIVNGCSVLSPGCTNCYAMKQAHRVECRRGLTKKTNGGMVWTGEVRFNEKVLRDPIRWKRPRKIFVCAHGDLFHDSVPDNWIDMVFAVMALCPQHTFQVLTKRSARMRAYLADENAESRIVQEAMSLAPVGRDVTAAGLWIRGGKFSFTQWPLPNVWKGVSVEDQTRADERIPDLLATPAAVRWLSCEPLLGEIELRSSWMGRFSDCASIDWVVAGGESGPGARPMHPDWARGLRDQCAAAGVAFLHKQNGEFIALETDADWEATDWDRPVRDHLVSHNIAHDMNYYRIGKKRAGRLLDGVEHDGYPA